MRNLNNGKLIEGGSNGDEELFRPISGNLSNLQTGRKMRKNIDPRKNYEPRDLLRMQMMQQRHKCSVFLDHESLNICTLKRGLNVDYYYLRYYLADENEGRIPQEFFCYIAVDPRKEHAKDADVRRLEDDGWLVKCKRGVPAADGSYKCGMSVDMAIDIISFAIEARPDIVILVTGNQEFAAVARKLREHGIRCEVAAFPENVSQSLINSASSFINLERYFDTSRADREIHREAHRVPAWNSSSFGENCCVHDENLYDVELKHDGIDAEERLQVPLRACDDPFNSSFYGDCGI